MKICEIHQSKLSRRLSVCNLCNKEKTFSRYLEVFNKTHAGKYRYCHSKYNGRFNKIEIECPAHGIFLQSPDNHLKGKGCPICSGNKKFSTDDFIKKAKEFHDTNFDYSSVVYKNCDTKVKIICPYHGAFLQTPWNHLQFKNGGCRRCIRTISDKESNWLDSLGVPEEYRQVKINCGIRFFIVDGFDPINKIVYEFNGDFWHGNIKIYDPQAIHPKKKITFGELYSKTLEKEKIIKSFGYSLISIWESEWEAR